MKLTAQGLTIGNVNETHERLHEALRDWNSDTKVDMSDVTSIDMCGIQLLISLQKTLSLKDLPLIFSGLSPYIETSIRLSGCTSLLDTSHE